MKRNLLVLSLIACSLGGNAVAQQDRAMTHFMYEKMTVNPAMTGINFLDGFCGTSIYRNQWDKVNGAPNSVVLNVEGNIDRFTPVVQGVGISFYHDAIANTRQNTAVLNLSHHFPVRIGLIGVGVGLGITNIGMVDDWVPPVTLNDPSLPQSFSSTKFDMNAGVYLKTNFGFYAGLSSTHIPAPSFVDSSVVNPTGLSSVGHYYLMTGHRFKDAVIVGDDIEVNLFVRTDLTKTSFDLNARYFWRDMLYGGLTYRMSDAIGIMAGANVSAFIPGWSDNQTLTVGYSYDISVHKLASVSTGSHEMFVKFCYLLPPVPLTISRHVRWL